MSRQILIVDDDTIELKKLREILSKYGYGIITATDISIAKELVSKLHIDFLLMRTSLSAPVLNSENDNQK